MKTSTAIISTITLAATLAFATQGFARWGGYDNYGPRTGRMNNCGYGVNAGLTTEQQKQAQEIEKRYQDEITASQKAIEAKAEELDRALADGDTTVAQAGKLRDDLVTLKQKHWQLRDKINREISAAIGVTYFAPMNPDYCPWHTPGAGMGRCGNGPAGRMGMMGMGRGMHRCNR